jgi:triosephosphate isomerase
MRKKVIAGNWKMNSTIKESLEFLSKFEGLLKDLKNDIELVIAPPYTSIYEMKKNIKDDRIKLSSQNVHFENSGAYTGDVSTEMIKEVGCSYAIIGHSERREYFGETDDTVNKRAKKALNDGIIPIVCVGEVINEREENLTKAKLLWQTIKAMKDFKKEEAKKIIIAYEPIWAIGTGKSATKEDAEKACKFIRETIKDLYDQETADAIRVLYGGSVKPENIDDYMKMENIDGALVGGASLKAESFFRIANFN